MNNKIIINLCDRDFPEIVNTLKNFQVTDENNKLLLGSYLCPNYLKSLIEYSCITSYLNNIRFDFVLPVFSESDINYLNDSKISYFINNADTIVINDYGLLNKFKQKKIRLGRLLFKDYRDLRYSEYDKSNYKGKASVIVNSLKNLGYAINEIEYDIITRDFESGCQENCKVYYHFPYRLVSTSQICEFASINKPIEKKFRVCGSCEMQCMKVYSSSKNFCKFGKGVYNILQEEYLSSVPDDSYLIITPRREYENNGSTFICRTSDQYL